MTSEQILKAAIQKAERSTGLFLFVDKEEIDNIKRVFILSGAVVIIGDDSEYRIGGGVKELIFSHEFAKAFWGYRRYSCTPERTSDASTWLGCTHYPELNHLIEGWEHHLQQMVISKDPIAYLKRFI